jgi:hypothetical protein
MPNAICVAEPGEEAAFLAPLPTLALWVRVFWVEDDPLRNEDL